MGEFKGTKGKLELKYVSGICIGIGTEYGMMTANSILPDSDKEYEIEREEIESNMLIYSKAPEMLGMLIELEAEAMITPSFTSERLLRLKQLIKEATDL